MFATLMILSCIAAGIAVGIALRKFERILRAVDHAALAAVFVLVFLLGVSFGSNREVLRSIGSLGLKALALALAAMAGSVAVTMFVHARWFREKAR